MSETEAKTKPASAGKLRKLRQDGMVPAGQEVASLAGAAAGLLTLALTAGGLVAAVPPIFEAAADAADKPFAEALAGATAEVGIRLLGVIAPVVGAALIVAVLTAILFNRGLLFSAKAVLPRLERVSPLSGLKRIYGRRGWIETGATLLRLCLWVAVAVVVGALWLPDFLGTFACGALCQAALALPPALSLVLGAAAVMILGAGIEMLIQTNLFLHEQMMTASEAKRERKEQSGDPEIRRERKRRHREGPPDRESIGVERANLCFFIEAGAIAVRFHPKKAPVPRIAATARGAEAAREMRERLRARGFPEAANARLVERSLGQAPGSMLDSDLYQEFAKTLRTMFAGTPAPRGAR